MTQIYEGVSWTRSDPEGLADNGNRYEIINYFIINGELFMTIVPDWKHQKSCNNICTELTPWSRETSLGEAATASGIIFTDADNVIPDVLWASNERLATLLDDDGNLTGAP
jgi:Uma2 family endonuclease